MEALEATDATQAIGVEAAAEIPNVFLRGMPSGLLIDGARERWIEELGEDLKLFMGNRHEHFRPLPETVTVDGRELRVFEWTHSTFVAE